MSEMGLNCRILRHLQLSPAVTFGPESWTTSSLQEITGKGTFVLQLVVEWSECRLDQEEVACKKATKMKN